MTEDEKTNILNQYAHNGFSEKADMNYISARTLYRHCCFDDFLYMSHQAIEKYLKAILLYNYEKHNKGGHDLAYLVKAVENIKSVNLENDTISFINELDSVQCAEAVRYNSAPFYGNSSYLLLLDNAVWDLRLFCRPKNSDDIVTKIISLDKSKIDNLKFKWPSIVAFGLLENILGEDSNEYKKLRDNLVWNNFCYGIRRKKVIKNFQYRQWSKNPPYLYQGSDTVKLLSEYIFIPSEIRKMIDQD